MVALAMVADIVRADEPAEPSYVESIVTPSNPNDVLNGDAVFAPPQDCWMKACEDRPKYYLTALGGASYFDADRTRLGGTYGASLYVPLCGAVGTMVRGRVNHYDGGSQYSGSVALFKGSNGSGGFASRLGWTVGIDQFTDTGLDSPYLVRGQYIVDYAVTSVCRVGLRYLDPIHGDESRNRGGIPGAAGTVPVSAVELFEAMIVVGPSLMDQFVAGVGYSDDFESTTFRVGAVQPLNDRLSATFDAFYYEREGWWSGFVGVQVDLSPRRIRNQWVAARSARSDVVRGAEASAISVAASIIDLDDGDFYLPLPYNDLRVEPAENTESSGPGGSSSPGGGGGGETP